MQRSRQACKIRAVPCRQLMLLTDVAVTSAEPPVEELCSRITVIGFAPSVAAGRLAITSQISICL